MLELVASYIRKMTLSNILLFKNLVDMSSGGDLGGEELGWRLVVLNCQESQYWGEYKETGGSIEEPL